MLKSKLVLSACVALLGIACTQENERVMTPANGTTHEPFGTGNDANQTTNPGTGTPASPGSNGAMDNGPGKNGSGSATPGTGSGTPGTGSDTSGTGPGATGTPSGAGTNSTPPSGAQPAAIPGGSAP
jgi:hypothetical protein